MCKMIREEELRIGDLVRVGQQVYTIQAVNAANGAIRFEELDLFSFECYRLDPIPITTEILEKNGWKLITYDFNNVCLVHRKHDVFNLKVLSNKGECLEVELDLMPSYVRICNHTLSLPKIKYVHELQHILWAFGLDANFKI